MTAMLIGGLTLGLQQLLDVSHLLFHVVYLPQQLIIFPLVMFQPCF